MLKSGTKVFLYDPLVKPDILPDLVQRVLHFPRSTETFTRTFMARLLYGDPGVVAYVATWNGRIVGHMIGDIDEKTFIVRQAKADHGYPRAIDIILEKLNNWCKARSLTVILQEVDPARHDPAIWQKGYKRYGFTVTGYTVKRRVA